MKKSIFKSVVSVFAAVTMVITNAASIFAANDYISYSNDFSSATGVTVTDNLNYVTATKDDVVMTVADGVLTSTRNHYDNETSGRRSNSTEAAIAFDKSISSGKIQAKFDFTMSGGANQGFVLTFTGYQTGGTGLAIAKSHAKQYYPDGATVSTHKYYKEDESQWIEDGVVYNAIVTLDIASATYTVNIVNEDDASDEKTFEVAIPDDRWGSTSKGEITGIAFRSRRDFDLSVGTIVFDNLSVDAYTESNYEVNSVYRSTDGLETNKKIDGYTFKGFALSKLTNFVDANASFITASYDGEGRMTDAVATPVSEMGSAPVNADVEGNTVKSFVLDRTNAEPLMSVYQYADPATTVRKLDFEDGFAVPATRDLPANMNTYGIYNHNNITWIGVSHTKVAEGDNNVFKFERDTFRGSVDGATKNYYWNSSTNSWYTAAPEPANAHLVVKLDEALPSIKVSLKFKFAGTENSSHSQAIGIEMGGNLVLINRNQAGEGSVRCAYSGTGCSWSDMKAGEWYTFTGEITASGFTCSVAGDFESGYAVKNGSNTKVASAVDYVQIGSPRDQDIISASLAEVKTPTSVWYIDDVIVEY